MIYSKLNDVQRRGIDMNDLLNIELCDCNLKIFDQAWDETLMAMAEEFGKTSWKGFTIDK